MLMQVNDEAAWTRQLQELEADEYTQKFKTFLVFWFETTDRLVSEQFPLTEHNPKLLLAGAASKGLALAEQTFGFLSIEWISQMLLVMTEYWIYGEELYRDLSHIEQRLVDQAAAMKLVDLQKCASINTEE
jgi:hypothetical protein